MKMRTMVKQTLCLSLSHFVVRMLGFVMRIWLSRELGAQAMGLVELAQSAQMLLITPVVSGLPAAISRMCAQRTGNEQTRVLRCGVRLALGVSLPLAVLAFLLREPIALWLGDIRTLPALIVYLPCIPVLGVSCALNGYYYGTGRPMPPALSELLEQIVRLLLCMRLVSLLRSWPVMLRSAIPALSTLFGETAGLLLMLLIALRVLFIRIPAAPTREIYREILSLSLPLTGMKLISSLMRTVSSALIPARLALSGLSNTEALAQLGMMNGMLTPMLTLPSFVTCSLSMVAAPELSRRQAAGRPLGHLMRRVLLLTLAVSVPAMAAVYLLAPTIAGSLYRQAELLPLLEHCFPLVPVLALCQVTGSLMNGLGMQGKSLRISLAANLVSVLLTYVLAAQPQLRLWGVIIAMAAAQSLTLLLNLGALAKAKRQLS